MLIFLREEFFDRVEVFSVNNDALRELQGYNGGVSFGFFLGGSEESLVPKKIAFDQDIFLLAVSNFDRIELFLAHFRGLHLNGILLLQLGY